MELFEGLRRSAIERPSSLRQAKQEGTKIVEYIGNFVPEEMIYAAGAKPYLMCRGGEPEPPDAVLDDVLRFMNPLNRSIAGLIKLGLDPVTPFADIIAISQHECHIQRLAEYLEFQNLPIQKVGVAVDWDRDFAQEYYLKELVELKQKLEALTGNTITDEKLQKYIRLFNEINGLLRNISELRKKDCPPLGGEDFIHLNQYTFFADPEYTVEQLKNIYNGLKDAPGKFKKDAPRLLLAGHSVAVGDNILIKKLEECGAIIANEMLEEGLRWYQWDVKTEGDPLRNIWRQRYLDKVPVNIFQPAWRQRFAYMKKLIEEYRIDGVIWYQLLYDEIWDLEYTSVAKWLEELNVPLLRVETSYEYTREAMLPLNTRLESFIEALRSRKGGK
ncbi:MAG TPA: 2-hydroxyacyl-CoA dehydratase family protein [Syntrophomonadaceae bacterium]|nr:2-hydroxyacyl-CoA dehydratase family protein [Syntrophomonadaceae bacterium]